MDKRFCRATITAVSEHTHKLEIVYSYWNLYEYSTTWVYPTLQDCINRLAVERCMSGVLTVKAVGGDLVDIEPVGG